MRTTTNLSITKDIVKKAKTYLPLAEKEKIAQEIAQAALTQISVSAEVGNIPIELPDYNGTDAGMKARYLMGALYKFWLGISFQPAEGTDYLLSLDDYDRIAESHPLNTLERLKADKETKDICFDLLRDYKELCEMCKAEQTDLLAARNDPVLRYLAAQAMTVTPEALNQLSKAEKQLRKETERLRRSGAQAQEAIRERNERIMPYLQSIPVDPTEYEKAKQARKAREGTEDGGTDFHGLRPRNDKNGNAGDERAAGVSDPYDGNKAADAE